MNYQVTLDFRSDTVTQPCEAMRSAMANAPVGDDVYGDDPTVLDLERHVADVMGKESALYVSSGTQSNLLGILAHCQRGDEYLCSQHAHLYKYEAGGAAVLGSVQPQPLLAGEDGTINLASARSMIKPDDFHFAKTRLLCVENTIGGMPLPLDYQAELLRFKEDTGLKLHLDGARLANAAVYHNRSLANLAQPFDSVSICLSKGLGAPIGSVLVGDQHTVSQARRWRKMLGGGWRQAGVLAAAARLAFDRVDELQVDHEMARYLTQQLSDLSYAEVDRSRTKTNMLFVEFHCCLEALGRHLERHDITVSLAPTTRIVTHRHITTAGADRLISALQSFDLGSHRK
jgi:threonine aldolase